MTGLELLGLLFLALLGLGAYAFYQACRHAPLMCEVCGREGCDGSRARCVERWR